MGNTTHSLVVSENRSQSPACIAGPSWFFLIAAGIPSQTCPFRLTQVSMLRGIQGHIKQLFGLTGEHGVSALEVDHLGQRLAKLQLMLLLLSKQ